jgi:hypothetical protein
VYKRQLQKEGGDLLVQICPRVRHYLTMPKVQI